MDSRIAEICFLLPSHHYEAGLIAGFQDAPVIEGFRKIVNNLRTGDVAQAAAWQKNAFDLIICNPPVRGSASVIKNTIASLREGGSAAFLLRSGMSADATRNAISFHEGGDKPDRCLIYGIYGISPSLDDIRLLAPVRKRACAAASLALYQPSLTKAKVRKRVAALLGRAGLTGLWAPHELIIAHKGRIESPHPMQMLARKHFGEEVEFALFTGTPGYLRKPTVQIMSNAGDILGYCKIGESRHARAVLKNEASVLGQIAELNLGNAQTPRLLFSGELDDAGTYYLIQSSNKETDSSAPLRPDARHADFMIRLMEQTKTKIPFQGCACHREVSDRLSAVRVYAGEDKFRELNGALAWATQTLFRENVMLCLAHRDFTPWNTFVAYGNLFVFDWEFARPLWLPLTDSFHFILQKGILVDKASPDTLWDRLLSTSLKEGRFLRQCAAAIRATEATVQALLAFYLCDMTTLYLFHYAQAGHTPPDGERLLATWQALLKRLQVTR